ncbi:hypothetical protein AMTR_s00070p00179750 [Amborella trichopoda]|uniref:Uncharacterized protein n=1 Tax=Amborella trichopoda TaxID=13333 RepID=U5D4Y9_AMBTC|nr:hypothetical protein AMTR_s00070p00179750 [Amborella trichopoda]
MKQLQRKGSRRKGQRRRRTQRVLNPVPLSKKRAKTKASASPTLSSAVTILVQETIPAVVTTQPSPSVQSSTLSPLSQGAFLCTITEEENILEDETEAIGGASDVEVTISEILAPTTSEAKPQPDVPSSTTLELMVVPTSEVPILTLLEVGASSKLDILLSEPLALVSQETTIIVEVPPLVVAGSSSMPSSVSNKKALLMGNLLRYDKETFDRFEGLLQDLERWGVEVLQCEAEVQALYGNRLASLGETLAQHQSLIRSHDERKNPLLSYKAGFKKEDSAYSAEIKGAEEERERLDIYIHQLKTK